jgi:hypothetical protein
MKMEIGIEKEQGEEERRCWRRGSGEKVKPGRKGNKSSYIVINIGEAKIAAPRLPGVVRAWCLWVVSLSQMANPYWTVSNVRLD